MESIERIVSGEDIVSEITDVTETLSKAEEYYDNMGMSLSFGVIEDGVIVLSSKHWLKNCYIEVSRGIKNVDEYFKDIAINNVKVPRLSLELWDVLLKVSRTINRELEHTNDKYVFITNLNRKQTLKVYEAIIDELNNRGLISDVVEQYNLLGWYLNDNNAVRVPWISGFNWE